MLSPGSLYGGCSILELAEAHDKLLLSLESHDHGPDSQTLIAIAFCCLKAAETHQVQQERYRNMPTSICLVQVAAGCVKDVAAHYRTLVAKHADDWELLLSFLDVTLSRGQPAASSQPILHGLEQVVPQAAAGSKVRATRLSCIMVMTLALAIRHICGVLSAVAV